MKKPFAGRKAMRLAVTGTLAIASAGCVQAAGAQPVVPMPQISGVAFDRANAIIATNAALSPENQAPTTFQNVVSLTDPDVVAAANAQTATAGHGSLHFDYFLFQAAIEKARRIHADKIDIPQRTYHVYEPQTLKNRTGVIDLIGLSHVVVDGHGSTLLFYYYGNSSAPLLNTHALGAIRIWQSDHVTLRNLIIDYDEPLAVPITVRGSGRPGDPQTFAVSPAFRIDPTVPMPISVVENFDLARRNFGASRDLDEGQLSAWKTGWTRSGARTFTCSSPGGVNGSGPCFKYVSGQTYAFAPSERISPVPPHPGEFLGLVRDGGFSAVYIVDGTSDITVDHVAIYSSPGGGIELVGTGKGIHIENSAIMRKPDKMLRTGEQPRYISTLSDAMDVIASQGDVVIENNEVGDQGDDGVNIRSELRAATAIDPHTLNAWVSGIKDWYTVGATVDLYDATGVNVVVANIPITVIKPVTTPGKQVISLATDMVTLDPGKSYRITPRKWSSSRVVVRNNWYHDNRARGVVVHGRDIAVLNNRFQRETESAVEVVYNNVDGNPEGAPANNVIIAGNLIGDVNREWYDPSIVTIGMPAAIAVYSEALLSGGARTGILPGSAMARRLVITDNVISNTPGAGILVSQADDVILAHNQVTNSGMHRYGIPLIDGHPIVTEAVANLKTDR